MPNTLFDFALQGGFTSNGVMVHLVDDEALANAMKIWLLTPRGDIVRNTAKGSFILQYLNKPLTDSNAARLKEELRSALLYDFDPPLQTLELEVQADTVKRAWMIRGSFYSETYDLEAKLDISVRTP